MIADPVGVKQRQRTIAQRHAWLFPSSARWNLPCPWCRRLDVRVCLRDRPSSRRRLRRRRGIRRLGWHATCDEDRCCYNRHQPCCVLCV